MLQFCVLLLNTTAWIYAPGRVLDGYGLVGVFAMIAAMYAIFTPRVQFGPEIYGKSTKDVNLDALTEAR